MFELKLIEVQYNIFPRFTYINFLFILILFVLSFLFLVLSIIFTVLLIVVIIIHRTEMNVAIIIALIVNISKHNIK
jgi:hypothetical protein